MERVRRRVMSAMSVVVVVAACSTDGDASPSTVSSSVPVSSASSSVPSSVSSSVPVSSVPGTAPELPAPTAGIYDFSAADGLVEQFIATRGLNGASLVVVERDDGIVHERYWGEFDADRVSFVASSSKMVTAGVLMYLHDEGLLDVDAPVAAAVDWGVGNPEITPAQLVSNSSGLVGLLPNVAYGPYLCQFLLDGTLQECAVQVFTTPNDDADVVPPDTEFRYGGAQWQVAGGLAEAVSGASWDELVDEIYVRPCGLTSFGYTNQFLQFDGPPGLDYPTQFDGDPTSLQPTDNPNMEAGVYTTARDYAALLLMHLRGGMCDDARVLSAEAVERLHADRIGPAYDGTTPAGGGYGMGWWVDRETGIISDSGAYGSFPFLDVEAGLGAVLIVEADAGSGGSVGSQLIPPIVESIGAGRTPSG